MGQHTTTAGTHRLRETSRGRPSKSGSAGKEEATTGTTIVAHETCDQNQVVSSGN
jgi:hypothetical protein